MNIFPRFLASAALAATLTLSCVFADDTVQRIYTASDPADKGEIKGSCEATITFALAVNHDRKRVYRGTFSADGRAFNFTHLPVGKYDLVMITKDKLVYEGLALGEAERTALPPKSMENLKLRVEKQDAFFNHTHIQRLGFDGPTCLLFVERTSDRKILRQNAEELGANLRRLEIMEVAQATDDWQVTITRHIYREEEPQHGVDFLRDKFVPEFGNLRVIDGVKDLGTVTLPAL